MASLTFMGKYGKVSEYLGLTLCFSLFFLLFCGNKQQDMPFSQHLIIIQSDPLSAYTVI